jgi:hypothetical protein
MLVRISWNAHQTKNSEVRIQSIRRTPFTHV